MRNLESVMKDLNAITGNPQRIPPHPLHITCNTQCWAFIHTSFLSNSSARYSLILRHLKKKNVKQIELDALTATYYISLGMEQLNNNRILLNLDLPSRDFHRVMLQYKPITCHNHVICEQNFTMQAKNAANPGPNCLTDILFCSWDCF